MTILIRRSPSDACEFSTSFGAKAGKLASLDAGFDDGLSDFFPEVETAKLTTRAESSSEAGECDDQRLIQSDHCPVHLSIRLPLERPNSTMSKLREPDAAPSLHSDADRPSTQFLSRSKSTRDLSTLLEDSEEEEFIAQPLKMARLSLNSMISRSSSSRNLFCMTSQEYPTSTYEDDEGDNWGQFVVPDGSDSEDDIDEWFWCVRDH